MRRAKRPKEQNKESCTLWVAWSKRQGKKPPQVRPWAPLTQRPQRVRCCCCGRRRRCRRCRGCFPHGWGPASSLWLWLCLVVPRRSCGSILHGWRPANCQWKHLANLLQPVSRGAPNVWYQVPFCNQRTRCDTRCTQSVVPSPLLQPADEVRHEVLSKRGTKSPSTTGGQGATLKKKGWRKV